MERPIDFSIWCTRIHFRDSGQDSGGPPLHSVLKKRINWSFRFIWSVWSCFKALLTANLINPPPESSKNYPPNSDLTSALELWVKKSKHKCTWYLFYLHIKCASRVWIWGYLGGPWGGFVKFTDKTALKQDQKHSIWRGNFNLFSTSARSVFQLEKNLEHISYDTISSMSVKLLNS